jgi:hypothetical protein
VFVAGLQYGKFITKNMVGHCYTSYPLLRMYTMENIGRTLYPKIETLLEYAHS